MKQLIYINYVKCHEVHFTKHFKSIAEMIPEHFAEFENALLESNTLIILSERGLPEMPSLFPQIKSLLYTLFLPSCILTGTELSKKIIELDDNRQVKEHQFSVFSCTVKDDYAFLFQEFEEKLASSFPLLRYTTDCIL